MNPGLLHDRREMTWQADQVRDPVIGERSAQRGADEPLRRLDINWRDFNALKLRARAVGPRPLPPQ